MGYHDIYNTSFERVMKVIEDVPGWMGESDCRVLYDCAHRVRAGCIVEIGCFAGRSTKVMATASPTSHITSIDPLISVHPSAGKEYSDPDDVYAILVELMKDHNWSHYREMSHEVAKRWRKGRVIDLLHIDGDHRDAPLRQDIEDWLPFVKKGGVVLFHDYAVSSAEPGCGNPLESDNGSCVKGVFEDIKDKYFSHWSYPSGFAKGIV